MPVPGSPIIIPFRKRVLASSLQVGGCTAFYKTPFFIFPYTSTPTLLTNESESVLRMPRNIAEVISRGCPFRVA